MPAVRATCAPPRQAKTFRPKAKTPSSTGRVCLVAVQHDFLRRATQLNTPSATIPLYRDMKVALLQYRRASWVVRYLRYLVNLPPRRLADLALRELLAMYDSGDPFWASDLSAALRDLPQPLVLPPVCELGAEGAGCAHRAREQISRLYTYKLPLPGKLRSTFIPPLDAWAGERRSSWQGEYMNGYVVGDDICRTDVS